MSLFQYQGHDKRHGTEYRKYVWARNKYKDVPLNIKINLNYTG